MTGKRALLVLALAAAVLPYFVGLGATSIVDANEAYYVETPREMIEAGDYLNPAFNYEPRFNKPPLSYWVVAGFYEAFGTSLWAARVPIALGALALTVTVLVLGRLAFSTDAGLLAALTLAAAPRFLLFSRRIIIDIHTAMYCGLALLFFALAEFRPARRRRWLVFMYAAVGLGVLTKGPVNAVLPAVVFVVYVVLCGRLSAIRRLMLPLGALIVAAIVLPYYLALYVQHGWTFINSFIFTENIGRFAEGTGAPYRGVFFYVPVVLADLYFPWSVLLPAALALAPWRRITEIKGWRLWRSVSRQSDSDSPLDGDLRLLLALWVLVIVGFFSLSRAQQDLYILPFVAGAAPLVGGVLHLWTSDAASPGVARAVRVSLLAVSFILAGLGVAGAWLLGAPNSPVHLAGTAFAGATLAAGGVAAAVLALRRTSCAAVAALVVAIILAHWTLVVRTLPDYERFKHVPQLARVLQEQASSAGEACTYKLATPSLVFTLRRHVFLVEEEEALRLLMRTKPELYCMMREEDYEAVRTGLGVPTATLAQVPVFYWKWSEFWTRPPLPRVVLVTNRLSNEP